MCAPALSAPQHVPALEGGPARRWAEHEALLECARVLLDGDERVAAAWLFGSRGRGDTDALSDIDLMVVVHDAHLEAVQQEWRALVARLGAPLLLRNLPRNAPPGGAYVLALYPGETGPLHVDWYWRGLSGAARPPATRAVVERAGVAIPHERHLCHEMGALLPHIGALRPDAGVLVPDAPREILRFIGWIERVMASGA